MEVEILPRRPVPEPKQPPFLKYFLIALVIIAWHRYEDVVIEIDGVPVLQLHRYEELEKKKEKIRSKYYCYKLIAIDQSYRFCKFCDKALFYLRENEVYRYGVTRHLETRYSADYLIENRLIIVPVDSGSLVEMTIREQELIFNYPLLRENLIRPTHKVYKERLKEYGLVHIRYKIGRPPGNPVDR